MYMFTKYLILFVILAGLLTPLKINASGRQMTTSDPNSGVVVRDENGVMYLTTELNPGTEVATPSDPNNPVNPGDGNVSGVDPSSASNIIPPAGYFQSAEGLGNRLLQIVMAATVLLALAFLIWGGFKWITSGGDKGKTDNARSGLISAVVGVIIVASSYAILLLVLNFLGYENLNDVLDDTDLVTQEVNL